MAEISLQIQDVSSRLMPIASKKYYDENLFLYRNLEKKNRFKNFGHDFIPHFFFWIKGYNLEKFRGDILAGLIVGIMVVPQSMAYATIAGLEPIYGLYSAIIPPLVYILLGSSMHLNVGPTAMLSLLMAHAVGQHQLNPKDPDYILRSFYITFLIGVICIFFTITKFGFISNLISYPVVSGFTSASCVIIALSQLKYFLGIPLQRNLNIIDILIEVYNNIGKTNMWEFFIACTAFFPIFVCGLYEKTKKFPTSLFVVVFGILVSKFFRLKEVAHINTIGTVPKGFIDPVIPFKGINFSEAFDDVPISLVMSLIGILESLSVGKIFANKKKYEINPSKEIFAIGIGNLVGSFFGCYAVGGSFTRTAVSFDSGGCTPLANLFSVTIVVLTVLFLTPYIYYLPSAILGAIVLSAVIKLFDYEEFFNLWKSHKKDFSVWVISFLSVLFFGVQVGILIAIFYSMIIVVLITSLHSIRYIGNLRGHGTGVITEELIFETSHPNIIFMRIEESFYFANAFNFKTKVIEIKEDFKRYQKNDAIDSDLKLCIVLDCKYCTTLDSTAVHAIQDIYLILKEEGHDFCIVYIRDNIKKRIRKVLNEEELQIFTNYNQIFDRFGHEKLSVIV